MPLPLVPVAIFVLRAGLVGTALWAGRRVLAGVAHQGRTDQRVEDAMDGQDEGLALHRPADRDGQRNMGLRLHRVIRWGADEGVEIDASILARWRLRKIGADRA